MGFEADQLLPDMAIIYPLYKSPEYNFFPKLELDLDLTL